MARNGFSAAEPNTPWQQQLDTLGLRIAPGSGPGPGPGLAPTAVQNAAQIAAAVTEANCTLSTDLAGIYFAIQASTARPAPPNLDRHRTCAAHPAGLMCGFARCGPL
jgi:hypothetical protein